MISPMLNGNWSLAKPAISRAGGDANTLCHCGALSTQARQAVAKTPFRDADYARRGPMAGLRGFDQPQFPLFLLT
jgi:hypothetical protein